MSQVRTRIAPSPTGDPHVGTAYIALFNRCFAHQQGGSFVLRIEDTDRDRSRGKSEQDIISALQWLGLNWDEGPDCGGDFGPYRQSERLDIYTRHIEQLLQSGHAFRCFCDEDRLSQLREQQMKAKQQTGYDGHCLALDQSEVEERVAAGEPHVIRMKIPESGECEFEDLLRDTVSIAWSQIDMQILIKSDGMPTYHFANVVDDHLMQISHVIRGEEWINSTPKHVLLYDYFGWERPVFCHMPLLRNTDKSKLSKRKNPTSIFYYRDMGYLPQAVTNYLGMMGWTLPSGEEKFSLVEMEAEFDISRVSLGGPIFDTGKLDWLNGRYIREDLSDAQFAQQYGEWAFAPDKLERVIPLIKERVERFTDVAHLSHQFLAGELAVDDDDFEDLKMGEAEIKKVLQFSLWRLEELDTLDHESVEAAMKGLASGLDIKLGDFMPVLFLAITGHKVSISVFATIEVLGLDLVRTRLRKALAELGGISKKGAKSLEKEYAALAGRD